MPGCLRCRSDFFLWALAAAVALLSVEPANAHPVPRLEYDRNLTISWRADAVLVLYRLEIDEFTLLTTVGDPDNGFPLPPQKRISRKDLADAYMSVMRSVIPDSVLCQIDGTPVTLRCVDVRVEFLDSVQFRFLLRGTRRLSEGQHRLEVEDLNFLDKKGRLLMKFDAEPPLRVERITEPREGRLIDLADPDRRTVRAVVRLPAEVGPPPHHPESGTPPPGPLEPTAPDALGPALMPDSSATRGQKERSVGIGHPVKALRGEDSLAAVLESDVALGVLLLLAFLHGILHSVAPGHGKTMVAAYLVGEQGTPRHAVALGLIVTLTHTSSAFVVALLLKFVLPPTAAPEVQRVLGLGGGLMVVMIGLWLLMQRLAGRADHIHWGGHSHSHSHGGDDHSHSHGLTPEQFGRLGWLRLTLLGISGGIVPCWGAILWVIYCITAGRYGLALWAVLAFSLGLASVLILIGLSVVWGGRAGARQFSGRTWFRYVARWLPSAGAAVVVLVGLWLMRMNLPD